MKTLLTIMLAVVLSGCSQLGHKAFYNQVAPSKYPPTSDVMIFEYSNVDLDEIYELLFSDFLIIGKSGFSASYENPERAKNYAQSIGADILITSSQFKETRTSFTTIATPTRRTTYVRGYNGSGSAYRNATTYDTDTTIIPIQIDLYAQHGIYLKNVNHANPLWERTRSQYKSTATNDLSGIWKNEDYEIEVIQSGEQMVAFISAVLGDEKSWRKDQLKMVFGTESGTGIYLMADKTPMPSKFKINKFGHLEVNLLANEKTFSFAKVN